ncbi:MAG TPA: LptF/LptG family permease [Bryobacteraceae bacterium]|nr:LptF/LptG family permease [Bryobacteraceae bacterium]
MKILSRYAFREILASSVLATTLATFVIFLQGIPKLFELLVHAAKGPLVLELFALALPPIVLFSMPFGVLVGILVGLGRLSSDNEMIAMRSAGVSTRIVVAPVLTFAFGAMLISGACALWLNPLAIRAEYKILNAVAAEQLTADVEPRVFEDQFTNDTTVLYVQDVKSGNGPVAVWNGVFIADLTPPAQRKTGLKEAQPGPAVTVAREAQVVPDVKNNRLQLTLRDMEMHAAPVNAIAPTGAMVLQAQPQQPQRAKPFKEMLTRELWAFTKKAPKNSQDWIESRIELESRFVLPIACMMLAMVGIPLGASSRKGGRSAGYVWAIFLAFFCYYLAYITLTGLARSHSMPVTLASWLPNAGFGFAGVVMIARMEVPGDRDWIGRVRLALAGLGARISRKVAIRRESVGGGGLKLAAFQILDSYVLSNFLFYFLVTLFCLITMVQVYTFFELLGDIVKNHTPMPDVVKYHLYLTPSLVYTTLPIAVLVSILATFGVMTKNNEVTAFKACGISVRRLGIPVLVISGALSAALFALDYSFIPQTYQVQDALLNEIKGRPTQTYLHPERKWIIHEHRIFYFRYFDPSEKLMVDPYVFELDPKTFHVVRELSAGRARWQQNINAWVWEQGVARDLCGADECKYQAFTATTFPEITETPDDFLKSVKQDQQMNYLELDRYIRELQSSGFDTVKLHVQYYKKFAAPAFALIMALISVPFGFLVGNRGAMAGVGVGMGVAMAYMAIGLLFDQFGNVNLLPPVVAAWSPDALFSVAGLYLMVRMRS